MIGESLGHYKVEEKLGEGGMGVVYRAQDTHLDRPVAIKVLRPDAVANPDRRKRFVQEAKSASALNHPNIITIHDITSENGRDYIVMEYVAGQALDRLIGHRGLPLREALRVAVQIADALAAAHEAGIVHRDLKPGNIMMTDKGQVKLLDFGLAKLTERYQTGEMEATETLSPRTEEGAIVGTVAYMSPEQAEGKKVDARSDIFSFGSVLYEMLTGRRPFQGETKISTLSSILHREPPPAGEIVEGVPRELEGVIARCLRKDPARRWQHMDDVRTVLEDLKEESESGQSVMPAPRGRGLRMAAWPAGILLLIGGMTGGVLWWRSAHGGRVPTVQPVLTRLTSDSGLAIDPVLSPDGKLVAYASDRGAASGGAGGLDIWVQQVATGERLRLTTHEADEREPAFSPDGSRIAYRSEQEGGGIYVVSTFGGEPRRIAKEGRGPRFSPSGEQIAYWTGGVTLQALIQGKVFVMPAGGGEARPLQPTFHSAAFPLWSPDGKRVLFLGARDAADPGTLAQEMDWWITPLEGDRNAAVKTGVLPALRKQKFAFGSFGGDWITSAAWLPDRGGDSRILFSARSGDARNIWNLPISQQTWQPKGEPERLTFGAGSERLPSAVMAPGGGTRLVFASLSENLDVWSLPLDANRGVVKGPPERLTQEEAAEDRPSVSLDGRRVAYLKHAGGGASVRWKDLGSGKDTLVANSGGNPRISPDGAKVAYGAGRNQGYVAALTGSDPELICEDCFIFTGWSRDGTKLLDEQVAGQPIGLVVPGQRKRIPILRHPSYSLSMGRFSPDDRWIVFHAITGPTGRRVFIAPFRDPSQPGAGPVEEKDWIPITDGSGMERYAAWSPDGNLLYFLSERDGARCLRAQRLDPGTKRPLGPPMDVQHFHSARRSLLAAGDPVVVNPSIAVDKVVFSLLETTGNIWMTEFGAAPK